MSGKNGFSRLYVQAIFALAAAVALSTSACGKNDGGGAPAPAAPAPAAPVVTGSSPAVGKVGRGTPSELDKKSGKTASDKTGEDPITKKLRDQGNTDGDEPGDEPTRPVTTADEAVTYYDPSGLTADQIFARKAKIDTEGYFLGEAVRSDIISSDGSALYYTGSGKDTLRPLLYTLVNEREGKLDADTQAADRKLSQTIQLSTFNIDWKSRRAELNFRFERADKHGKIAISNFTLLGPVDNLALFHVGNVNKFPFIEAAVACMDNSGGCKTVHIRVQDRSEGITATAHLIARKTKATMFVDGTNSVNGTTNKEYARLLRVLLNTKETPNGQNIVEDLTMTTSETIGGASNVSVGMQIRLRDQWGRTGGDMIVLSGPLAKPKGPKVTLDVHMNVGRTLTVVDNEIVPTDAIATQNRFIDGIAEARLVRNDGQGNLMTELTIRTTGLEDKEEKLILTFARIHTPTSFVRIPMQ